MTHLCTDWRHLELVLGLVEKGQLPNLSTIISLDAVRSIKLMNVAIGVDWSFKATFRMNRKCLHPRTGFKEAGLLKSCGAPLLPQVGDQAVMRARELELELLEFWDLTTHSKARQLRLLK